MMQDNTVDPGAGLRLGAELTLLDTVEDQLWPAQDREEATFMVVADTAEDLAGAELGDAVVAAWKPTRGAVTGLDDWRWRFCGKLTGWKIQPHEDGGSVAYAVATGYVHTDLDGTIGLGSAWPQEVATDRLDRILTTYDYRPDPPGSIASDPTIAARAAAATTRREAAFRLLASWRLDHGGGVLNRFVLAPELSSTSGVVGTTRIGWLVDEVLGNPLDTTYTVDADYVRFGGEYALRPDVNVNRVEVTGPFGTAGAQDMTFEEHGSGDVIARVETDLVALTPATELADMYLPPPGAEPWQADTFTWLLYKLPTAPDTLPVLGERVAMAPIAVANNPNGTDTYTGLLTTRLLRVSEGKATMELTLRPWSDGPAPGIPWGTAVESVNGGSGPDLWLRLQETSGTSAADFSGNGRAFSYENGAANTHAGPTVEYPDAQLLDGTNDFLTYFSNAAWVPKPNHDWTIAQWVKFTATGFACAGSIRRSNGLDASITLNITIGRTAGHVGAETWNWATAGSRVLSDVPLNDGAWHLVAFSFDNATRTLEMYVDGVLNDSKVQAGTWDALDRTWAVGANRSGSASWIQFFPGAVAHPLYWAAKLSALDHAALYASRSVAP